MNDKSREFFMIVAMICLGTLAALFVGVTVVSMIMECGGSG